MGFLENIDLSFVLINVVILLFSLSLHESAHAWVADRLGDPTGRYLRRVTINPIPHIDPIGTLLFPILGIVSGLAVFGWAKPVPVNTRHLKHPARDHSLIAAAGPLSNLVAAVFFLIAFKAIIALFPDQLNARHPVIYPLFQLFGVGVQLNVILTVFNLIPIPPLDGS